MAIIGTFKAIIVDVILFLVLLKSDDHVLLSLLLKRENFSILLQVVF